MPLKKIDLVYEGAGEAAGESTEDKTDEAPSFQFAEVARLPEDGDNVAIARR